MNGLGFIIQINNPEQSFRHIFGFVSAMPHEKLRKILLFLSSAKVLFCCKEEQHFDSIYSKNFCYVFFLLIIAMFAVMGALHFLARTYLLISKMCFKYSYMEIPKIPKALFCYRLSFSPFLPPSLSPLLSSLSKMTEDSGKDLFSRNQR